ncbi:transporter substrate-binding domain-containing protein, partial [Streptomyces sp. DSM 41493]
VQLADFSQVEASNFSFAMAHDNARLQRVLNSALAAIPISERMNIQRRWSAGGSSIPGRTALHFSASEQRWMDAHPSVRVAVDDSFLPLSFFNEEGEFRGISADVLAKVSLRTGLKFDVARAVSVADMVDKVRANKADLLITLTPSTSREGVLHFTRPY